MCSVKRRAYALPHLLLHSLCYRAKDDARLTHLAPLAAGNVTVGMSRHVLAWEGPVYTSVFVGQSPIGHNCILQIV